MDDFGKFPFEGRCNWTGDLKIMTAIEYTADMIDILFVGDEVVERTDEDDLGQKDPSERQAQREGEDFVLFQWGCVYFRMRTSLSP